MLKPVVDDITRQLSRLVYPGFVGQTPAAWLACFPRFIEAAKVRLSKAGRNLKQDKMHADAIEQLWSNYATRLEALQKIQADTAPLTEFRWLIEELRVSLFAQELKTSTPVSLKKLETLWQGLR